MENSFDAQNKLDILKCTGYSSVILEQKSSCSMIHYLSTLNTCIIVSLHYRESKKIPEHEKVDQNIQIYSFIGLFMGDGKILRRVIPSISYLF